MASSSNPPEPPLPGPDSALSTHAESKLRRIFIGSSGIRAGWRFAIFVLIFLALEIEAVQRGLRLIPWLAELSRKARKDGVLTPEYELTFEVASLAVTFFAAWIMSRIEKQHFGEYGVPLRGAFGKRFWQGYLWGLAFVTIEMVIIWSLGGFSFGSLALSGLALAKFAILWAVGMTFVGLYEEFLFRGYAQFTLASGMGFWPAAILLSALFGGIHLLNPGEGWVGAIEVFTFAMFACLTLRRTGNLWFAIGFHAAGDFAETFIYSLPDSGMRASGQLLNSSVHGPRWLTGGTIGPEGSAFGFALFIVAFLAFNWIYPPKKPEADVAGA